MTKYLYVVTTKYGKELRAELELGDTIFPYDTNVEIRYTKFKGVLLLITKLDFKELIGRLLVFPPSCVERIVPVDICCSMSNLFDCLESYVRSRRFCTYRFGRKGSLNKELIMKIEKLIRKYLNKGCDKVLHIEPIDNEVCIGITGLDEDKFYKLREKRLGDIIKYLNDGKSK